MHVLCYFLHSAWLTAAIIEKLCVVFCVKSKVKNVVFVLSLASRIQCAKDSITLCVI